MTKPKNETESKQVDLVFNPGSERNIISICLKEADKIIDLEAQHIYPEHLLVPANRFLLMTIFYLKSKGIKPTPMSVLEALPSGQARDEVDKLGGLDYLMLLDESTVDTSTLSFYIEKVKQSYTRKMMHDIAVSVKDFVLSDKAEVLNPSEIINFAEQKITDLGVNSQDIEEVYKMGSKTEAVLAERAENPATVPGLEVGWHMYDKITNGAQPGDLIIVCAPSKTGKSVVLTNWATKLGIRDKLPILYIDTEMNEREQEDRILANLTGIPHDEIVSGMYVMDTANGLAKDKVEKLKQAREELNLGNYYHIYMPQFTPEKVMALTRKFQMQFGIVALFFDYIKIPSNQADFRSAQEYQKLGFFTSSLKDLAGMLKIPVFSACQTNRSDNETSSPNESNIGGSYRILQLASKLMFLYNKSDDKIARDSIANGNQQLFIKFQRNGQSDCDPINIMFNKPILRQTEV